MTCFPCGHVRDFGSHAPVFREWILKFTPPARVDLKHPLCVPVTLCFARGASCALTRGVRLLQHCGHLRALHHALSTVVHKLWKADLAVYSPDCLLKTVWKLFPSFVGFKQQVRHAHPGRRCWVSTA